MYVIRHIPTGKWIQPTSSANKFGENPRPFTSYGSIKAAITAYVEDNKWRRQTEAITESGLVDELEVCEIQFTVLSAIPASKVLELFQDNEKRRQRHLPAI